MKRTHKGLIAILASIAFALSPAIAANADALKVYENIKLKGASLTSSKCTVDLVDNIYDSGTWRGAADHTSIWNNTIIFGDEKIGTIYNNVPLLSFVKTNAADHATCNG